MKTYTTPQTFTMPITLGENVLQAVSPLNMNVFGFPEGTSIKLGGISLNEGV